MQSENNIHNTHVHSRLKAEVKSTQRKETRFRVNEQRVCVCMRTNVHTINSCRAASPPDSHASRSRTWARRCVGHPLCKQTATIRDTPKVVFLLCIIIFRLCALT